MTVLAAVALPRGWAAEEQKQDPPRYTVTDLGTLGGTSSYGDSINNKGRVVGIGSLPGDTNHHDFLWRKGVKVDLGTLGGPNSDEFNFGGPNERGQVVGDAETNTPDPLGEDFCSEGTHLICLPFLWQDGVMSPLPTLGGNNGVAADINNGGQVVGFAENTTLEPTCPTPRLQWRPFLWEKGEIQELPTFPGDPVGGALAINDKGQAVGASGICLVGHSSSGLHALLWQNGTLTDLGNLGGTFSTFALDINNQGQVVGVSDLPGDANFHAFLWQNGAMTDLGTLPGDFSSVAVSINNSGQAVGGSFDASGNCRSFLWQDGVMTDLNTLIPAGSPYICASPTTSMIVGRSWAAPSSRPVRTPVSSMVFWRPRVMAKPPARALHPTDAARLPEPRRSLCLKACAMCSSNDAVSADLELGRSGHNDCAAGHRHAAARRVCEPHLGVR